LNIELFNKSVQKIRLFYQALIIKLKRLILEFTNSKKRYCEYFTVVYKKF